MKKNLAIFRQTTQWLEYTIYVGTLVVSVALASHVQPQS